MSAATIARALGGYPSSDGWWRCRCPAHGSKSASLALRDGGRGLAVKCFAGCRRADVLAALARLGLYSGEAGAAPREPADAQAERRRAEAEAGERQRKIALARDIWEASWPAQNTIVERYLRARLPGLAAIPETIRFLPRGSRYAWHPEGGAGWPAMIARIDHVAHGPVAVTRTSLSPDGGGRKASFKAPRQFTGRVGGAAVHLGAPRPDMPLVIAEGVESALAAMIVTGCPAWAALSAGGIEALALPDGVRDIVIAADHDANGTGERAARNAALRWVREGWRARIALPPEPGTDFNDLLRGHGAEGVHHAA